MKTYSVKPTDISREWFLIDASETTLGRVSTKIATLLTGKGKTQFSHHIDCGDFVVVINTDKLKVTGKKLTDKMYYHHSHFPGGLKEISLEDQLAKDSTKVLHHAVRGMLPVNKLRDERLNRLKIYAGAEHKHAPQQPKTISVKDVT